MASLVVQFEAEFMPLFQAALTDALEHEVSDAVVNILKESAMDNIYSRYTPHGENPYQRRMSFIHDESYETSVQGNVLTVKENVTGQGLAGDRLGEIIEAGTPYEWTRSDIYKNQPFPRPFFSSSLEDGINNGTIEAALKRGLERQGF